MADAGSLLGMFEDTSGGAKNSGGWCYNYNDCMFKYKPCDDQSLHYNLRYSSPSAAWVLIASIIVFFMKAGFMLLEVSFARTVKEKRNVIILKHQDAFASAFGFFLLGFDFISHYGSPQAIPPTFFGVTDPVLWFFKFTFASNAATIIGGCLVTTKYKLRLPAAFISAFVISGIVHPLLARIIWSDECHSLSPYRFCDFGNYEKQSCGYNCSADMSLASRLYVLDFAGGGAVHLLGGMAGLIICLFAKLQESIDAHREANNGVQLLNPGGVEEQDENQPSGFWDWMYPVSGGEETVSEAALGVTILWFCWFAFNCGSTESVEIGHMTTNSTSTDENEYPYYGVPSVIAVNMIMSAASGGTLAIIIAIWAQMRFRTESMNANEIANGILSSLVSITAACPFVDYWAAVLIGLLGVLFYHLGCYLEYKLKIKDTAHVVPVHGVCGLWSLLAVAIFQFGGKADCNLHAAFEGLCYCSLRLPPLNWPERLLAQIVGAIIMILITGVMMFIVYGLLFITPISPFVWFFERVFYLNPGQKRSPLHHKFRGGWLLTSPQEEFGMQDTALLADQGLHTDTAGSYASLSVGPNSGKVQRLSAPPFHSQARDSPPHSDLGSRRSYGTIVTDTVYTSSDDSDVPPLSHTQSARESRSQSTRDHSINGSSHTFSADQREREAERTKASFERGRVLVRGTTPTDLGVQLRHEVVLDPGSPSMAEMEDDVA